MRITLIQQSFECVCIPSTLDKRHQKGDRACLVMYYSARSLELMLHSDSSAQPYSSPNLLTTSFLLFPGKSFLLKYIVGMLPPAHTFVTASTGVAACQIGGMTLHSFAGLGRASGSVSFKNTADRLDFCFLFHR